MIRGGGDPPRPKVQILDILGNSQNNGYFSRLRRYRKHNPDNIRILHCAAPQGRKFWGLGGFTMIFFIFAISHAYFLMFSYIILIYLCKLPYFTYHLGRGDPPTQSSNLRLVQIKIFLNYFVYIWPMEISNYIVWNLVFRIQLKKLPLDGYFLDNIMVF